MYTQDTPRTTGRVLGEDPNMSENAAKAACTARILVAAARRAAITQGFQLGLAM